MTSTGVKTRRVRSSPHRGQDGACRDSYSATVAVISNSCLHDRHWNTYVIAAPPPLRFSDLPLVRDRDTSLQRLGDGTASFEHGQGALGVCARALGNLQVVLDADRGDTHHSIRCLYRAFRLGPQFVRMTGNPARLQRARQGPGESPGRRCDQVVERAG